MPEIPDLHVYASNLQKRLAGKKLQKLQVNKVAKTTVGATALRRAVEGKTLQKVYREGKELRLVFSGKTVLGIHLMLHGKPYWQDRDGAQPFTLFTFFFTGGIVLAVVDFQKAARLSLNPAPSDVPDVLSTAANAAFWKKALQSNAGIKKLLMDQQVVRGIGNAYSDDILWKAGISPFSIANKIPPAKITALRRAIKSVLANGEKQIRKQQPDMIGGVLRDFMLVHNAKRKLSPGGALIKKAASGGRKTYYTSEQKLYK